MLLSSTLSAIALGYCAPRASPSGGSTAPASLANAPLGVFRRAGAPAVLDIASHSTGLQFGPDELAYGLYRPLYDSSGWDVLEVHSNPNVPDCDGAFGAGFFEGAATARRIEQNAVNSGVKGFNTSGVLKDFLAANERYRSTMIAMANDSTAPLPPSHADRRLWYHHSLVQAQLDGLEAGYAAIGRPALVAAKTTSVDEALTPRDFLLLQVGGDLEDLAHFGTCNETGPVFDAGRCSALIRLTPNNADLLVSQSTWAGLNSMLRMYKMYELPFLMSDVENNASRRVPAERVSFSSYPGTLNSGDDFYVLSSGLIQQETTIGNSNHALASRFISPFTVLEWRRNIVANRLATSCDPRDDGAWSQWYRKENSGTYNNQNMCVDFNRFAPGEPLVNGTFVITEQIPGYVVDTDLSSRLQRAGYFGSYNVAYDAEIRTLSGADANAAAYGAWFDYERTARAQIFARDAPSITDLSSMKRVMRSCDFKHDPLSTQLNTCVFRGMTNCTPAFTAENCIATRGDLNPVDGVWGISAFGHRNHVQTDTKIASYSSFDTRSVGADIVCGEFSVYRYISRESCSQFDSLPLTSLTTRN